jgi:signal transduction histidine kinase
MSILGRGPEIRCDNILSMSLKLKISVLVSGLLAGTISAMTGILLWNERRALSSAMREEKLAQADALAEVCRDALINQQFLPLTNYLLRLKSRPEVEQALCVSKAGEVLGHTDVDKTHSKIPAALSDGDRGLRTLPDGLEASTPVLVGPNRMASARILFSEDALRRRFEADLARARGRILQVSVPVLLAGFAGAFLLTAVLLKPLGTLVEGVRTIAGGKWEHRVSLPQKDEVGWLGEEFNQMAEKLGDLDRLKQDFVSSVTHDLKSPIAATRLAVDVIQQEAEAFLEGKAPPARMAESFLHVRERLERLTHLISSLLDVARIESLVSLEKRPLDLEATAERALKSFEIIARRKGLELRLNVNTKIPPVPGDPDKLERALANLVGNAVKFTEKGLVEVRLSAAGGRVEASVSDTGPGIPPEAMEKLFSKFFRLRRPGEKLEGTGLGLAIAKGFTEAHGGSLSVQSAVGRGTTFTMSLPL